MPELTLKVIHDHMRALEDRARALRVAAHHLRKASDHVAAQSYVLGIDTALCTCIHRRHRMGFIELRTATIAINARRADINEGAVSW